MHNTSYAKVVSTAKRFLFTKNGWHEVPLLVLVIYRLNLHEMCCGWHVLPSFTLDLSSCGFIRPKHQWETFPWHLQNTFAKRIKLSTMDENTKTCLKRQHGQRRSFSDIKKCSKKVRTVLMDIMDESEAESCIIQPGPLQSFSNWTKNDKYVHNYHNPSVTETKKTENRSLEIT